MREFTYRFARPEDAPALGELALEAGWHHYNLSPETFAPPTPASSPSFDLSGTSSTSYLHVAEHDGKVVGFVSAEAEVETREYLRRSHFVRVNLVAVSARLRGQGIGKRLVALAEKWGKGVGCTEARLNVWAVNGRAAELYEELGYQVVVTTMAKGLNGAA
jgi:ribosomal protein S18 acetylase RimI-like enzyme